MDGIQFCLNGTEVIYEGSAADRLLDVLRDTYRMTSSEMRLQGGRRQEPAPYLWTGSL